MWVVRCSFAFTVTFSIVVRVDSVRAEAVIVAVAEALVYIVDSVAVEVYAWLTRYWGAWERVRIVVVAVLRLTGLFARAEAETIIVDVDTSRAEAVVIFIYEVWGLSHLGRFLRLPRGNPSTRLHLYRKARRHKAHRHLFAHRLRHKRLDHLHTR